MPKAVYATTDALAALESTIRGKIDECRNEIAPAVKAAETRLQGAIQAVAEQQARDKGTLTMLIAQTNKDCQKYTDQSLAKLHETVKGESAKIVTDLSDKIEGTEKSLSENIKGVDEALRNELALTVRELCDNFDKELEALKGELLEKIDKTGAKAAEALEKRGSEIDKKSKSVEKDLKKLISLTKEGYEKEISRVEEEQAAANKKQDEYNTRVMNDMFGKLDAHDEAIKLMETTVAKALKKATDKVQEMIDELIKDHGGRLVWLEAEADKLRDAISEVENSNTRRVDWVIKNASKVIRPNSASKVSLHKSWFSPKFNLAGCHGLQLELQYYRPSDPPVPGEADGDAAVHLWAGKATNISYRIYVGSKYVSMDKLFNGRVPFGTKRFCWLAQQINREDDTLTVSVEIMESHRKLEHVIEMPPEPAEPPPPGANAYEKPLDGVLHFHRHVNNRLFDQVKSAVDVMKSRMVRKIEWRVENASKLRQCFGSGESICSTTFNAAGIEGLQLMFYPSGYKGANDGWCSLYLYGPAGATLRCFLILGANRREATHSFEEHGAFGRTNFCRLENAVEEDGTILVGLEIEEAHQDMVARVAHALPVPGDRRSAQQMQGGVDAPVHSIVKLQAKPDKPAGGLEETKILPSLWTAHFEGAEDAEGPNTMDDLKKMVKGAGKAEPRTPARLAHSESASAMTSPVATRAAMHGTAGDWSGMKNSGSMPSLTQGGGFEEMSPASGALPRMSRTAGFSDTPARGPRPRRPRRADGLANTSPAMAAY